MSIFQALILGIIQGVTEFLPISSSGHLILFPHILNWGIHSLSFDLILHLGTLFAIAIFFFKDLLLIFKDKKLFFLLIVGSLPVAVLGYFFESVIESTFRSATYVALFLFLGSIIMLIAEVFFDKISDKKIEYKDISIKNAFLIGIFQSLGIFSGFSRSGVTISGGMLLGLSRDLAAKFSFLLAIPAILGATVFKLSNSGVFSGFDITLLVGFIASFVFGFISIKFLLKFLKSNSLYVFVIYRIILVCLILFFV